MIKLEFNDDDISRVTVENESGEDIFLKLAILVINTLVQTSADNSLDGSFGVKLMLFQMLLSNKDFVEDVASEAKTNQEGVIIQTLFNPKEIRKDDN
jgi:hypothetical protein